MIRKDWFDPADNNDRPCNDLLGWPPPTPSKAPAARTTVQDVGSSATAPTTWKTLGLAAMVAVLSAGCRSITHDETLRGRSSGVTPSGTVDSEGGSYTFGYLPGQVIDLRDLHTASNTPANLIALPSGVMLLLPSDVVIDGLEIWPDGRITATRVTLTASGQLGAQIAALNAMVEQLAAAHEAGEVARANALTEAIKAVVEGLRDLIPKLNG